MSIMGDIKDKALSVALKAMLTSKVGKYLLNHELTINSEQRKMSMTLLLKGESSKLEVEISEYTFAQENGKTYFVFNSFSASREWLDDFAQDHLLGRRFKIPDKFAPLVSRFL